MEGAQPTDPNPAPQQQEPCGGVGIAGAGALDGKRGRGGTGGGVRLVSRPEVGQKVGMQNLPIVLAVALLSSAAVPSGDLFAANKAACAVAKAPSSHVGQVLRFRAEFRSDYRHRSRVRPLGCENWFAVDYLSPEAQDVIVPGGFFRGRPWSERLVVTVTGHLTQRKPNGAQFQNDDGVRFDVLSVEELQSIDGGHGRTR